MLAFLKRLCEIAIQVQIRIGQFCTGLPFWKDVERCSMIIAGPVKAIAGTALRLFPFLRRFEAYLEVESLKKRPPVILALSITILAFRGNLTSPNGNIGTDTSVFPFHTLESCFNPFLGALSAIAFGGADLLQKLVKPDIYGAMKWTDPNYYGALGGYLAAYSITLWMGVMPGLMSRVGRKIAISIFLKIRAKRAAAQADGATPALSDPDAAGIGLLGNMLGAMITAFTGVKFVAPVLEWPAFHWRPTPDLSCYKAELVTLDATAHRSALMGIVGGAVAATLPPESSPPPPPVEVDAPIPPLPPPPPQPSQPPPFDPAAAEAERIRQSIKQLEDEVSENRRQADFYRSKLADGDPRQRDFYQSQIRFYENNASHYRDNIEALKGDGVLRHTRTDLDELNAHAEDPSIREAREKWLDAKAKLEETRKQIRETERLQRIENQRATLEALEAESSKGVQSMDVIDSFASGLEDTVRGGIADMGTTSFWKDMGDNVINDLAELSVDVEMGAFKGETYLNAASAVAHSAKGMAEGMVMLGKLGYHVFAHPIDSANLVLGAGGDPLAAIEFVTRTADQMAGVIVDPKKRLSERLQGVAKLEVEMVMGEGVGKALGYLGKTKVVRNLADKFDDLKAGIFGKPPAPTEIRIHGTGQTVGREAEQAAMAKLPPGHPARKIGEINEAAAKAGPEFNSRLVKGDRLLNPENPAYQKGIEAIKANPKYLTPEAKKLADAVRYDVHLRAQEKAVQNLFARRPELRGHLQGIENTGSHAWRRADFKPTSDIDINALGKNTPEGRMIEELYPAYYDDAVREVSGGTRNAKNVMEGGLSPEDIKANCYGDGKAKGALDSQTGKDFVGSYKATGKGRLDVIDNDTGKFSHSLDGNDPLLHGERKFFDSSNPAEAAAKADEFRADVAAKHFEETAGLPLSEQLRQGVKNVKTIGNITAKLTGQTLPEPIAKIVKNAASLSTRSPAAQQQALDLLQDFLKPR